MANQLLQNILDQIGEGKSPTTTVRTFLAWFDAYRRRAGVVDRIRAELAEYELETVPDFESAWIDSFISFVAIAPPDIEADQQNMVAQVAEIEDEALPEMLPVENAEEAKREAGFRVSKLTAANRLVQSALLHKSHEGFIL